MNMIQIVLSVHISITPGFVSLIIGTTEECSIFSFLHNKVPIFTLVTFEDRQNIAREIIGHEITNLRFIGTDP